MTKKNIKITYTKKICFSGIICLILFFILFILGELIVKKYYKDVYKVYNLKDFLYTSKDPWRQYKLIPNVKIYNRKTEKIMIQTNKQGFRRNGNIKKDKPRNIYRIFILGGSTAFSSISSAYFPYYAVHNNETIDYFLEKYLNSKSNKLKYEVINAALPGYNNSNHYVHLMQKIFLYNPDLIIFIDGHNDYYSTSEYGFKPNHYNNKKWLDYLFLPDIEAFIFIFDRYLLYKSYLYHYFRHQRPIETAFKKNYEKMIKVGIPNEKKFVPENFEKCKKHYNNFLKKIIISHYLLCKQRNIKIGIFLQPQLLFNYPRKLTEEENLIYQLNLFYRKGDIQKEFFNRMHLFLVDELDKLSKKYRFIFSDLSEAVKNEKEQIYTDDCHLSVKANKLIAKFISDKIIVN